MKGPTKKVITHATVASIPNCVQMERSFGTASGFDQVLQNMRRFLEFQLNRFLMHNGIQGKWSLVIYVSRED